jgi:hypothetical protein
LLDFTSTNGFSSFHIVPACEPPSPLPSPSLPPSLPHITLAQPPLSIRHPSSSRPT